MTFIRSQEELRANLFSQIKDVIDGAEAENRGLDSAELNKINAIEADIARAEEAIQTAKRNEARMVEASVAAKGFIPSVEAGDDETLLRSVMKGEARSAQFEYRTLTSSTSTVPTGFADQVFMAARAVGPILETSDVFNTQTGENIVYPVMSAYSTAALRAEGSALPSSDPTFTNITLGAIKYGVLVPVSNELLTDAGFDIQSVIAEQAGNALGYILNDEHTTGDGTGNPNGIVTASGSGVTGLGTAGGFTADELIDLVFSIDQSYRTRATAGFMVSSSAAAAMRKLKDGDNRYLYELRVGEPDQFMGYRVHENLHMAAVGPEAKSVLFGDLANYKVRLAGGIQVAQSSDYAFNTDVTTFRVVARADGDLANAGAVKHFIGGGTA
jgi:HK97 family phage major capsid protein